MIKLLIVCVVTVIVGGCTHSPGDKEMLRRCPSGSGKVLIDSDSNTYILRVLDDGCGGVNVYITPELK